MTKLRTKAPTKVSSKASSKATTKTDKYDKYFSVQVSELSFEQLIEYNLKFLNGDLRKTFYHGGPVNEETLPLLDKLKAINSFGFFTMDGQPSLCIGPAFDSGTWDAYGIPQGNWWYKIEQKGYLVGFIEKSISNKNLIKHLLRNDKVHISIASKDGKYVTNFPNSEMYNVTRRSTRKSESENWSKWLLFTNIPNEHHFEEHNIKALDDCLFIKIAVKNYCEDSLEDILLNYYNTAS
jgi:hypothetical protein